MIAIDTNLCVWFISHSNGFRRVRLDLVLFHLIGASYINILADLFSVPWNNVCLFLFLLVVLFAFFATLLFRLVVPDASVLAVLLLPLWTR